MDPWCLDITHLPGYLVDLTYFLVCSCYEGAIHLSCINPVMLDVRILPSQKRKFCKYLHPCLSVCPTRTMTYLDENKCELSSEISTNVTNEYFCSLAINPMSQETGVGRE